MVLQDWVRHMLSSINQEHEHVSTDGERGSSGSDLSTHPERYRPLIRSAPATRVMDVASTAGFVQMLLGILRNAPAIDQDELGTAERLARTAEFKRDLVERGGGALTAEEVRKLLGHKTIQAVHKAVSSHRLFCVDDNGRKLFPAFQFDGAALVPGMATVLAATPTTKPWALLQFMVEGDEGLGDERPTDMVKGEAEAIQRLVRFASTLEV